MRNVSGVIKSFFIMALLLGSAPSSFSQDLSTLKRAVVDTTASRDQAQSVVEQSKLNLQKATDDYQGALQSVSELLAKSSALSNQYLDTLKAITAANTVVTKAVENQDLAKKAATKGASDLKLAQTSLDRLKITLTQNQTVQNSAQNTLNAKTVTFETAKTYLDSVKADLAKAPSDKTLIAKYNSALSSYNAALTAKNSAQTALNTALSNLSKTTASLNTAATLVETQAKKLEAFNAALSLTNSKLADAQAGQKTIAAASQEALGKKNAALSALAAGNANLKVLKDGMAKAELALVNASTQLRVAEANLIRAQSDYQVFADATLATKLVFSAVPSTVVAGREFNFSISALTKGNTLSTSHPDAISISSSDLNSALPRKSTLLNGTGAFSVTLKTAGEITLTATDGTLTTTAKLTVLPAIGARLIMSALPSSSTAGTAIPFSLTVKDQFDNIATSFGGPISFVSSDIKAALPPISTLMNGQGSFFASFRGTGTHHLTAMSGSLMVSSNSVSTSPGPTSINQSYISVSTNSATVGDPVTVTLTLKDAFGNLNPSQIPSIDQIAFISATGDGVGSFGAPQTIAPGVFTSIFTGITGGITAVSAAISGTHIGSRAPILIASGNASQFALSEIPSSSESGNPITVSVKALDSTGKLMSQYFGSITVSSSDSSAILPSKVDLINGEGTLKFTLRTIGKQTITLVNETASTTSPSISVTTGPVSQLVLSSVSPSTTAGTLISMSVTAKDNGGNTVTGYNGTLTLSSSDPSATFPETLSLSGGIGSFSITFKKSGTQTLTVSDGSIKVSSSPTLVAAGAFDLSQSTFSATDSNLTSGTSTSVTLTLRDAYGNLAPSDLPSISGISFASSLVGGTGNFSGAAHQGNGVYTASFTAVKSGAVSLGATINGAAAPTTVNLTIAPGAVSQFILSQAPSSSTAGSTFNLTAAAADLNGNTVSSYNKSIQFTSTDPLTTLPSPSILSNGSGSFSFAYKKAGVQSITLSDGTLSVSTNSTTVGAGAVSLSQSNFVSAQSTIISGTSSSVTLTLKDAYGNSSPSPKPTVADIAFSSSLVGGTGRFSSITDQGAGIFTANFTGDLAGSVTLSASVFGNPLTTTIPMTIQAGAASMLAVYSGNNQIGNSTQALALPLTVIATDAAGNPTSNATITWALGNNGVTGGNDYGTFGTCSSTPDTKGLSTCAWTLGAFMGTQSVTAYLAKGTAQEKQANFLATGQYPQLSMSPLTAILPWYNNAGSPAVGKQTITLRNTGTAQASGCEELFSGLEPDAFTASSSCSTIDPGQTCSFDIVLSTATVKSPHSATLLHQCSFGGSVSSTENQITFIPYVTPVISNNAYGNIEAGSSKVQAISISNTSAYVLKSCGAVSVGTSNQGSYFTLGSETCSNRDLNPGETCTINLTYSPTTTGSHTATLNYSCLNNIAGVGVSGTGVSGTLTSVASSELNMGNVKVGRSSAVFTYLFHNSSFDYRVSQCSAPVLSNSTNFTIVGDECGSSNLEPNETCKVSLRANPTVSGSVTTSLTRSCISGGTATLSSITSTGINDLPSTTPLATSGVTPGVQPLMSSGANYRCTVTTLGRVLCWGRNNYGQLGINSTLDTRIPTFVSGIDGTTDANTAISVSAGNTHACALMKNGAIKCWGNNGNGRIGNGLTTSNTLVPYTVPGIDASSGTASTKAMAVVAGNATTCAIMHNYTVKCFGDNTNGETGNGATGGNVLTPTQVTVLNGTTADLSANSIAMFQHACVTTLAGTIYCWGLNANGQLGIGSSTSTGTPTQVSYFNGTNTSRTISAVSVGYNFSCALSTDQTVRCWGSNTYGQLGDNTSTNKTAPVANAQVLKAASTNLTNITQLSSFGTNSSTSLGTCALDSTGVVYCWGNNTFSQLGDGGITASKLAKVVPGITSAAVISVGIFNACATLQDSSVKCWGGNAYGEHGDGTGNYLTFAQPFNLVSNVTSITTNGDGASCATLSTGGIKCWGTGATGVGTYAGTYTRTPVTPSGLSNMNTVENGGSTKAMYAINNSGTLYQWGTGYNAVATPTPFATIGAVSQLAGGSTAACALRVNGTVNCWGTNSHYQLGNGTTTTNNVTPGSQVLTAAATPLTNVTQLAFSGNHGCAIKSDRTLWCWGNNTSGQLGDGGSTDGIYAFQVPGISNVSAITVGLSHTCALIGDGTVQCWGANSNGEVGINSVTGSIRVPSVITTLSGVTAIAAGSNHTCALLSGGIVKCWGLNGNGELGDKTIVTRKYPVLVPGVTNAVKLFASVGSTYSGPTWVLKSDGSMMCWGRNTFSNTGVDETTLRTMSGF